MRRCSILARTALLILMGVFLGGPPDGAAQQYSRSGQEEETLESYYSTSAVESKLYTNEVHDTVLNALEFLRKSQNPDGSWGRDFKTANTALAGLAMLSEGSTTSRGHFAGNLKAAVEYFLDTQEENGYYSESQSRMHGHGFATLFMAEIAGQSSSQMSWNADKLTRQLKESLTRAVDLIVDSQAKGGGFPYHPNSWNPDDHEGSITVTCIEALRAARNAGIAVPKESIDNAVGYMKSTYNGGSFDYALGTSYGKSFALSAAGSCVLIACGDQSLGVRKMIDECEGYMKVNAPFNDLNYAGGARWGGFFYYSMFYATRAFHYQGGRDWKYWYNSIKRVLLTTRLKVAGTSQVYWGRGEGYEEAAGNPYYATAMAVLILQTPNKYLPISQK